MASAVLVPSHPPILPEGSGVWLQKQLCLCPVSSAPTAVSPSSPPSCMEASGHTLPQPQGDGCLQSRNTTQPQCLILDARLGPQVPESFQMKETKIQGQIHAPNWDKRRNHLNIQQGIRCSNNDTGMGQNIPEWRADGYRVSVMTWEEYGA